MHYVPIKDLTGNEDLKQICKQIKFYEDDLLPEDTKREQLIKEIIIEINWQLEMVSPNVNKQILSECYDKVLEIEKNDKNKSKNKKKGDMVL